MLQLRQLAAIIFTDIVGYTALMGKDEQKAFDFLNKNRAIQKPIIEQYRGRWVKELGDGVMASFFSVSDAAMAAIKIQEVCNANKEFQLRIGIHVGEVVFENDDVFGDGVNIAARIQALAPIGGIWISEAVHHNLVNKNDITTEYVKTIELKNVKEPIRIYQIILKGQSSAEPMVVVKTVPTRIKSLLKITFNRNTLSRVSAIALIFLTSYILYDRFIKKDGKNIEPKSTEKSIAVLPFTDMSPEKDQEYLGDGLAEGIISKLSGIKDFKVIGRTSSFQFKGEKEDLRNIGNKLNVGTILEGSVQKSSNTIRITVQLIRVKDNMHLWSKQYDREMNNIFKIQDEISANIAALLEISFSESKNKEFNQSEISPESYTLYLKGLYAYREEKFEQSIDYNLQAIKTDSTNAPAYAYIALAKVVMISNRGDLKNTIALKDAQHFAYKSINFDPQLAVGHSVIGRMAWQIEHDFSKAREYFEKSILYDPNASLISNRYAYFLVWMGDFEKAVVLAKKALQSDPVDFNGYVILSTAYLYLGKFKEAGKMIDEGIRLFPDNKSFHHLLIQKYFREGSFFKLINACNVIMEHGESLTDAESAHLSIAYFKTGQLKLSEEWMGKLQKLTEASNPSINYWTALIFASRHQTDSCVSRLQKSFENFEPALTFLKIEPTFAYLRNNPEYQKIYRLYGFANY